MPCVDKTVFLEKVKELATKRMREKLQATLSSYKVEHDNRDDNFPNASEWDETENDATTRKRMVTTGRSEYDPTTNTLTIVLTYAAESI